MSTFKIFSPNGETRKLAPISAPLRIIAKEYKEIATKYVLNGLTDEELKQIAQDTLVPDFMQPGQFEGWWKAEAGSVVAGMGRKPSEARSVQELHMLLEKLQGVDGINFDSDDQEKFKAFFTRVKTVGIKDMLMLIESISMLADHLPEKTLGEVLTPLKNRVSFWPSNLENVDLNNLEVWGKLQVKDMPGFIKAGKALFGEDYLAQYALLLPLRCLSQFCEYVDRDLLADIIIEGDSCSSDILLWIWKNIKGPSDPLAPLVNIRNVSMALSQRDLPAAWAIAQRELKKISARQKRFPDSSAALRR